MRALVCENSHSEAVFPEEGQQDRTERRSHLGEAVRPATLGEQRIPTLRSPGQEIAEIGSLRKIFHAPYAIAAVYARPVRSAVVIALGLAIVATACGSPNSDATTRSINQRRADDAAGSNAVYHGADDGRRRWFGRPGVGNVRSTRGQRRSAREWSVRMDEPVVPSSEVGTPFGAHQVRSPGGQRRLRRRPSSVSERRKATLERLIDHDESDEGSSARASRRQPRPWASGPQGTAGMARRRRSGYCRRHSLQRCGPKLPRGRRNTT